MSFSVSVLIQMTSFIYSPLCVSLCVVCNVMCDGSQKHHMGRKDTSKINNSERLYEHGYCDMFFRPSLLSIAQNENVLQRLFTY